MTIETIKNKPIIIDSNILYYCGADVFKLEIRKILRILANNNNQLGISELSGFEVLKNSEKKDLDYFYSLLDYIANIPINKQILANSVILHNAYKKQGIECKNISPCDFMIGGTALSIKDAILFTANRRHYPSKIWNIDARKYIVFEDFEQSKIINLYFLSPIPSKIINSNN